MTDAIEKSSRRRRPRKRRQPNPLSAKRRSGRPRHQSREPISFFTVSDVAEHLGVSTRTVRRWIDGRRLIAHHFGRAVRIAEEDLRAFLTAHRGELR